MGIRVLLDLIGGVSLLLWGLHMVHSGILRAFGAKIRRVLANVLRTRFRALLAGIGVTTLLQSSTATAMMLSSFSASGMVSLVPALAIMLGANIGTALIVQALAFDSSALAPILLIVGVIAFKRSGKTLYRDLGRVAIGFGLMLLSLHILLGSLAPAEEAPVVKELFAAIAGEPLLTLLIGAVLTWAAHSSVATVLLTMSLAYSSFITPTAAFALILGASLGSAMNPLLEGVASGNPAQRRLPVGNMVNRLVGCVLFLPILDPLSKLMGRVEFNPVRLVADFHLLFNVATALVFILPLNSLAALLERVLPEHKSVTDPSAPLYLDESVLETPSVALACATREALHMGDIVETMLRQAMTALLTNDRKLVTTVCQSDDAIDHLHEAIKLYIVKITRDSLEEADGRRAMEILSLSINLEHIGDIVDKNLMELASKKIKRQSHFSKEGVAELTGLHHVIMDDLRLAFSVFLSGDVKLAHQLLHQKARIREMEAMAAENHLARLRDGRPESIQTSALHLDVLRDLTRIHYHICEAAYPALETSGVTFTHPDAMSGQSLNVSVEQSSQSSSVGVAIGHYVSAKPR